VDIKVCETPDVFGLPEWRTLHALDPHRHIFSTPEWNKIWWEEFGHGNYLFVLVFSDPEPVGIAPLMLSGTEAGGKLRFVGGDDLTDYLGPISAGEEYLPKIADALVQYLKEEMGGWGYLEANCLPVHFGFAEWLVEAADRWGLEFSVVQDEVSAVLPLPNSFENYLLQLPPRKRHELRRKLRRFEREAPSSTVVTSTEETLKQDVLVFIEMHRGSEGLKGKFMAPERADFFARIAESFHPTGLLSLDFLEVSGRRIASTVSFRFEDTFYSYNSAYQSDARELAPGLVLAARLIERAIAQGISRFDFLRGSERYKFDLGAEPLPLHSVTLTNRFRR